METTFMCNFNEVYEIYEVTFPVRHIVVKAGGEIRFLII